ncbi:hypothetical protein GPX89_12425 [Nocardia sp. ET3-3]|uniref:Uncharacterized protein n=1 Tax=Nocardia terrae TaxID=2675851 RepID=A0A7K1UW05_9NOCA|nr:hypothetical protein [Nocardia terrae]MVU78048.1 hypothetical protein [Nocardia terrae]
MAIRHSYKHVQRIAVIGAVQLAIMAGASTVTAHADASPLETWCNLNLGQDKADILAAMGTPNGDQANSVVQLWTEMSPSSTSAEWDTSGAILLAGFDRSNNTVRLTACDANYGVSPIGAPGLAYEPFRNQDSRGSNPFSGPYRGRLGAVRRLLPATRNNQQPSENRRSAACYRPRHAVGSTIGQCGPFGRAPSRSGW